MSNPRNWPFQPYDHNQSNISNNNPSDQNDQISSSSTTTIFEGSSSSASALRNNNNNNSVLSPDQGRVSKPIRRRSRASRRTPTTVLNTNTTNFRAMVQQFTGSPSSPFPSTSTLHHPQPLITGGNLNFSGQAVLGAANTTNGFHVQYNNPSQENSMVYMIDHNNIPHGGGGGGGGGRNGGEGGGFGAGFSSNNADDDDRMF